MLSYMLPVENKPPGGPGATKVHNMQLPLDGGGGGGGGGLDLTTSTGHNIPMPHNSSCTMSKDTSMSSFVSDMTIGTASHSSVVTPSSASDMMGSATTNGRTMSNNNNRLLVNGVTKHQNLKRVSFGSSKGSMVETLIFESPVQEESEPTPVSDVTNPFPEDYEQTEAEREKVRVSFFQQSKPQEVDLPSEPFAFALSDTDFAMACSVQQPDMDIGNHHHPVYNRMESTEGWENPFRPGGDLSREADEIVELIKEGKPITPTPPNSASQTTFIDERDHHAASHRHDQVSPTTNGGHSDALHSPRKGVKCDNSNGGVTNGSGGGGGGGDTAVTTPTGGAIDIKRGTIKLEPDAAQIEHVTIKKKPKCKCCVLQ